MDLIFNYQQSKNLIKNKTNSVCQFKLYEYNELLHLFLIFKFSNSNFKYPHQVTHHQGLTINLKTGNILSYTQIINHSINDNKVLKSKIVKKENNFKYIQDMVQNSIYFGFKKLGFWGVKYERMLTNLFEEIHKKVLPHMVSDFYVQKKYRFKHSVSPLFDMLVDFHLYKKGIKGHDAVYSMIQKEYPLKKWLKKNDFKFVPSILDSYGIKSKYLNSEINKCNDEINILSLTYLCKLFGESYIDYLKKINWVNLINDDVTFKKKFHTLKNKYEKIKMVQLLNDWEKNPINYENIIDILNNLFTIREFLESKGFTLKFNVSNVSEVELLLNKWKTLKNNFKKGYFLEYSFDSDFLNYVESDIIVDSEVYSVKILKTEYDFFTEGHLMKNCMGKQFSKGVIFIYISLSCGKTRVNLEYRSGKLISSYGKANTVVEKEFHKPIEILTNKLKEYHNITWIKEKKKFEI